MKFKFDFQVYPLIFVLGAAIGAFSGMGDIAAPPPSLLGLWLTALLSGFIAIILYQCARWIWQLIKSGRSTG
jgi:amino acid transporter